MSIFPRFTTGRRFGRLLCGSCAAAALLAAVALAVPGGAAEPPTAAPPAGGTALAALQPAQSAEPAIPAPAETALQQRLDKAGALLVGGEKLHPALLQQFYAMHNYLPVWQSHPAQAEALLGAVMRSGEQGLDPDLFHAALLRNPAALSPMDRELVLSDAFLSYADALARGILPIEIRMDDEDLKPAPVDVPAVLNQAIDSPNPASVIGALAPHSPTYLALRQALQYYRSAAPDPRRAREVEINLERQRWLPRDLPNDRVWVNIATAHLTLYRDNRPIFATRVVVGQDDKQTPELESTIDSVLFNPPWNVPPSIVKSEIAPKLERDPGYLQRHHMVWRHGGGIEQLPPSALGHLKFEMADRFDVYLHDTPERFLFARADRRRSHGCVRVQNPYELASLLLGKPVSEIEKAVATKRTYARALPTPVPVFLVYQTAFLGPEGRLEFVPDVYQRDDEIWQRLHPLQQAPIAEHDARVERRG